MTQSHFRPNVEYNKYTIDQYFDHSKYIIQWIFGIKAVTNSDWCMFCVCVYFSTYQAYCSQKSLMGKLWRLHTYWLNVHTYIFWLMSIPLNGQSWKIIDEKSMLQCTNTYCNRNCFFMCFMINLFKILARAMEKVNLKSFFSGILINLEIRG